jgi:hypothetical protein
MSEGKGSFKRKEDFSPEEWVEIYKKALRLRLEKKLSPAKIGKILNISPDTVATWIYGLKQTPNEVGCEDWDEVYRLRCKIWAIFSILFRKKNREKVHMTVFRQAIETSDRRTLNISRLHLERWSREDRDILMSSSRMNDPRSSVKFGDLPQIPNNLRRRCGVTCVEICQIVL